MANYFSNHSSSRFLANSGSATTTTATAATTNSAANSANPGTNNAGSGPPRPRVTTSKHFSTTVSTNSASGLKDSAHPNSSLPTSAVATQVHPLRSTWIFWFRQQRTPGNKIISYEEGIKKIAAFSSVESFWSLWTHLTPPSALLPTTDYLLFHSGIRRPVWEDPLNLSGGKWIIRLKKGIADRFWEDLVMAVVGDQFDECRSVGGRGRGGGGTTGAGAGGAGGAGVGDKANGAGAGAGAGGAGNGNGNGTDASESESGENEWPEICGCTISVRQSEDIVTVWNRVDGDLKVREQIRDTLRKVLNLPPSTVMEYKSNNDSMQDKSSFRRTAIDKTTLSVGT